MQVVGSHMGGRTELGGVVNCREVHAHQLSDRMVVATNKRSLCSTVVVH